LEDVLVPGYQEHYALFYDGMRAALEPSMHRNGANRFSARVRDRIDRYMPEASSLLELGCGTGTVLAGLQDLPSLTGLDLSPWMLSIARTKVPAATFIEGDMAAFDLRRQFDVVICVFDTLNHLTSFDQWISLFDCACAHLVDGGIFAFDVVTLEGFRRFSEKAPFTYEIGRDTLITNAVFAEDDGMTLDFRIFKHLAEDKFVLRRECVRELGVRVDRVTDALAPRFEVIELEDQSGRSPDDESNRVYFVAVKRRK
jgi:SAM-dependent methyltransferase